MPSDRLLEVADLSLRYPNGKVALRNVDLAVDAGQLIVVLGSNGSGKSSLLRCIARLVDPTEGSVFLSGVDLTGLSGRSLREARMRLAMIFQSANLVRRRSVLANVMSGTLGRHSDWRTQIGVPPVGEASFACDCLKAVGLEFAAHQRAGTLSGGQAQRSAIARALAQRPQVLLADEPVASLDPEAAEDVMDLLRRLASHDGLAVVCVLHQPQLAVRYGDRIVGLRAGQVQFDLPASAFDVNHVNDLYGSRAA